MSRTFRDAISVTRSIGLSRIWIDSWKTKAAKMADIYANGFVTIAVTSARGAT